jgi:uncharacterized damage-inducible protein DinB
MSTSTLLLSLFQCKAWANGELFAELQKVHEATHPNERHTCLRLLNHIYVVDRIFVGHLSGVDHGYTATNTPETPTFDALQAAVSETDRWFVEYIGGLAPERMQEQVRFAFTDGTQATMSREEMLGHVVTHGSYHRGAVGRILAQVSVPPPRDVFTGFLHKVEPQRRVWA